MEPAPTPPARKSGGARRVFLVTGIVVGLLVVIIAVCVGSALLINFTQASLKANSAQAPVPGTNVLFSDPLTSNTNGWSDNTSHCFFQDNAYHIKSSFYCLAPAGNIGDAIITVKAEQVAGSLLYLYGIVFRRVSTGNWYEFDIDSNGKWAFFKIVNDTAYRLVDYTPNAAIKGGLNTINTLLVQAKGAHFVFSVNGTQVGKTDDSTFASGRAGLSAGGADTEAAYTDFEITAA
jgi:hypothetical protein